MIDVVYIVGPGDENESLRYSLRSLQNLKFKHRVWIVGYCPSWVKGVKVCPTAQNLNKYHNAGLNILTACQNPQVSRRFVLMNDDFFVMRPISRVKAYYCDIDNQIQRYFNQFGPNNRYAKRLSEARDWLQTNLGPEIKLKSYELHVPFMVDKKAWLEARTSLPQELIGQASMRTIYGNFHKVGGKLIADVKIIDDTKKLPDNEFVSTWEHSFDKFWVGREIRRQFPDKCRYEV